MSLFSRHVPAVKIDPALLERFDPEIASALLSCTKESGGYPVLLRRSLGVARAEVECNGKLVAHAQGTLYVRDPK